MPTWEDLESRFTMLQPEIGRTQIHYQTGEDRRYWLSEGTPDVQARFATVAKTAGLKLLEVDPSAVHDLVQMKTDPTERWYEALRQHSDYFRKGATVDHQPRDGVRRPSKFGSIDHPVLASIWICKQFADAPVKATTAAPTTDAVPPLEGWLRRHRERWGTTWAVVVAVIAALGTIGGIAKCSTSATDPHKTMGPPR
jgi:hypothetical protein